MKVPILFLIAVILLAGCAYKKDGNSPSQPSPTLTAPPSTANSNSIAYENNQYGFRFSLPSSWKGYSIVISKWEGNVTDVDSAGAKSPETGPMLTIRDPRWTEQTPRQDIPVMVFTTSQWDSLRREQFSIGAAAVPPSELGRNDTYVFAIPARYNFAYPPGYEEAEQIIKENTPLKALN
ncbi:hypothetical protein ELR57_14125 [Cohnella sp. AR92]|nr:hypothetical protein ELR57_14125 [Cohnella sp. AR92]